jgi:hypothetical protein
MLWSFHAPQLKRADFVLRHLAMPSTLSLGRHFRDMLSGLLLAAMHGSNLLSRLRVRVFDPVSSVRHIDERTAMRTTTDSRDQRYLDIPRSGDRKPVADDDSRDVTSGERNDSLQMNIRFRSWPLMRKRSVLMTDPDIARDAVWPEFYIDTAVGYAAILVSFSFFDPFSVNISGGSCLRWYL